MSQDNLSSSHQHNPPVRVDVWLWSVRIFKTRSLAQSECKAGHVRIDDSAVKPSRTVKPGDVIRVRYPGYEKVLKVIRTISRRVGAPIAVTCYEDLSEPYPSYLLRGGVPRREPGAGRPTKAQRRELNKLRGYEKS
ncbi:RNA-binding S4 domain-containing protein [Rothia sp. P6271]|uniref:RNA-binding S4 domain-containing protein n=1 Tax=unclassified Rothia (in: high G+C Gram-positive bacteria) TaxID=2689056 RepID=UPI003ACC63A7